MVSRPVWRRFSRLACLRARIVSVRPWLAYDRALPEDPSVIEVRIGFANLLFRLGMPDRAVSLLEGVDDLDWHGRRVYALALAQYSTQKPERMEEAREALEEVLDERDDDPNLLLALGQLLHRMNRIEEAEAVIAELRQQTPRFASAHFLPRDAAAPSRPQRRSRRSLPSVRRARSWRSSAATMPLIS